jgi:peroxiredoxin
MFPTRRSWLAVVTACLVLTITGCPSKPSQDDAKKPKGSYSIAPTNKESAQPKPKHQHVVVTKQPKKPLPPPTMPKVNLSEELRANCLVKVGDSLPKIELPDLADKTHPLDSLYGKKLTVVCAWAGTSRRAQLEAADTLRSLTNEIALPFANKGVQVIGIEIVSNDLSEGAKELQKTVTKLPFPCLVDMKGDFLAQIAKDHKLPRVFLLDAQGKILWFDVEFSRFTREDLVQGIRAALDELK